MKRRRASSISSRPPSSEVKDHKRPDLKLHETLGLDWTPAERDAFLDKIKVLDVQRPEEPFPPNAYFLAGTEKAKEEWGSYSKDMPLKKSPARDCNRRIFTVPLHHRTRRERHIRDADTKELVFVCLRNFTPDDQIRHSIAEVAKQVIRYRRDDRREDPGMLTHFGYTCGDRRQTQIMLAASKVRLDTPARQRREDALNRRAQGAAGLLWNIMRSRLPPVVIDDFNDAIREGDFPRMDMRRSYRRDDGIEEDDKTFSFRIDGREMTFSGLEVPPPASPAAVNYARFTHNEVNGNDWLIGYKAHAPSDPSKGGNFYVASYGILMLESVNTCWCWHPTDYHGTTLYEMRDGKEGKAGYEVRLDGVPNLGLLFPIPKGFRAARRNSLWLDHKRTKRLAKEQKKPDQTQSEEAEEKSRKKVTSSKSGKSRKVRRFRPKMGQDESYRCKGRPTGMTKRDPYVLRKPKTAALKA